MRWLVLILIASISIPATAQEGQEFEKLIQQSLTFENPGDDKREEVEFTVPRHLAETARPVPL